MVRLVLRSLVVVLAAFALACSDTPSAPPMSVSDELTLVQAESDIFWSRGCPAIGPLNTLAILLISHNNEDRRQVIARLADLNKEVSARRRARIQERAHALVAWLLDRHAQGKFRGTDAQFAALINAIYCFAGIDLSLESPANTTLILPSDQPQVVTTEDGSAGVKLEANPVSEPTLLTIEQLPDTFDGAGLLATKLDQYPGYLMITKQSENDAPLTRPVVVGVCATGVIPSAVRSRLRLGHGKSSGFEIAAPGNAGFLSCPNQVAAADASPLWKRLATQLLPAAAHAFQDQSFGGGVGGTVTEFSPFAPVDPLLEFGGGVGGTVTEFSRGSFSADLFGKAPATFAVDCSAGAAGMPVMTSCAPFVTLRTRLGTALASVPVTWSVTGGTGTIAARSAAGCGLAGPTAVGATSSLGRAEACWTLGGALGVNGLLATPSAGGDAPAGVTFVPAGFTWSMTSVVGLQGAVVKVSGDGQSGAAGTALGAPLVVRVTDAFGNAIAGASVGWQVVDGAATVSPVAAKTDANGLASAIVAPGLGPNTIKAFISDHGFYFVYFTATGTAP